MQDMIQYINDLITNPDLFFHIKDLAKTFVIFCDDNIKAIYGNKLLQTLKIEGLNVHLISFEPGEENKTRATKAHLEDELFKLGIKKDSLFIAIGGGVTSDLIGFLAATYLRGVKAVYIPTTLLAMVDAAIGGKVGVNTTYGKNLIGTIYSPLKIFIDPNFLSTLCREELINGYVEMLKHGLIKSKEHFEKVRLSFDCKKIPSIELILESIKIKEKVVKLDLFEKNIRKILNFGHTFGHAIEILSSFRIPHGKAVAIGILMESYLSMRMGILGENEFLAILDIFKEFQLKESFKVDSWKMALSYDKKNKKNSIEFIVLNAIGSVEKHLHNITYPLTDDLLSDAVSWIESLNTSRC